MKIKFTGNVPETESCYKGVIKRAVVSNDKKALRVYVEFEEFEGMSFLKYVPISTITGSPFYVFCSNMEIISSNNDLDTNNLIGLEVVCDFNESNGRYFINNIQLYKYYTHLFEDEDYEGVDFDA